MLTETEAFTTEDIEYLRHGDAALTLRLHRPAGAGPFPTVVDLHGGAWCKNDLTACGPRDEVLAEAGFAAAALDFRHAGDGYPTSLIDINYAVRWLKAHAGDYGLDASRVALVGQSSGGHLAMLAAMRPEDSRYASIALEAGAPDVDARVQCVGMLWPVINPLSRYRNALRERAKSPPAEWVGDIPESHDLYWVTDEKMTDGNPVVALETGEAIETPPAIWIQGRPDPVHDYLDPESDLGLNEPERFVHRYREAGGDIELVDIDNAARASASIDPLTAFLRKHLG
jgi:acetyl esterase/lipase